MKQNAYEVPVERVEMESERVNVVALVKVARAML